MSAELSTSIQSAHVLLLEWDDREARVLAMAPPLAPRATRYQQAGVLLADAGL